MSEPRCKCNHTADEHALVSVELRPRDPWDYATAGPDDWRLMWLMSCKGQNVDQNRLLGLAQSSLWAAAAYTDVAQCTCSNFEE